MNRVSSRPSGGVFPRLVLGFFTLLLSGAAFALPITKAVDIRVVDVCSSTLGCASDGPSGNKFYQAEVNAIWAQAGIKVNFVSETYLGGVNNSYGAAGVTYGNMFYNINDSAVNSFSNLDSLFGGANDNIIYMYLVHSINVPAGGTTYGEGWVNGSGFTVAMDVVVAQNRMDTVAHELGHNLGLLGVAQGGVAWHSNDPNDLMGAGSIRTVPTSIGQISTDGVTGLDRLPGSQVAVVTGSYLVYDVVPEPSVLMLLVIGLVGVVGTRRRARFMV